MRAAWVPYATLATTLGFASVAIRFSPSLHTPVMRTFGFTLVDLMFGGWLITVMAGQSHLARLCRLRPLIYLGTISYGVYLLHSPLARLTRHFTNELPAGGGSELLYLLAAITLTILAAALSWHWFEAPILNWRRQLRAFRPTAASAPADH